MSVKRTIINILVQLKAHAPFTFFGALIGLTCMLLFRNISHAGSEKMFQFFHPAHVFLSAMVTASLFKLKSKYNKVVLIFLIGYIGSIGVATLSDSIIPFLGENIMGIAIPTHGHNHEHHNNEATSHLHEDHTEHNQTTAGSANHESESATLHAAEHEHDNQEITDDHDDYAPKLHLGFIEEWYAVTPAAVLGILFAFFVPATKLPHAAHVLISTWASSAHILMNTHREITVILSVVIIFVLFVSVWLPCCISDIVFPMLFVTDGEEIHSCCCGHHHHKKTD